MRGFHGGYEITGLQVNGRGAVGKTDDTMMRIDLDTPLAAARRCHDDRHAVLIRGPRARLRSHGARQHVVRDRPVVPAHGCLRRCARMESDPYMGQGEFYLEYGDIDYVITLPAGFVVAGSGVLQNRSEVLSTSQIERLDRAARSSTVIPIITADEAAAPSSAAVSGTKTWRFRAENVRDVAWAAAPDFRWDATSWDGILTQAFYQFPKAGRAWESAAEQTQWSIRTYSQLWFRYPYPQATSVAGPVGGMEYPMFVMVHYGTTTQHRSSARSTTSRAMSGFR